MKGIDDDDVFGADLAQQPSIMVAIVVVDKDDRAIDAALGHVERDIRQDQACAARHGGRPLDDRIQCLGRQRCKKSESEACRARKYRLTASVPFKSAICRPRSRSRPRAG